MKKTSNNFLAALENTKTPLIFYILSFCAYIIIENFLEIFSDPGVVFFRLLPFSDEISLYASVSIAVHVMHCCLWWVAVVLLFPIVFTWITKESIAKTLRATLGFAWIMLLTPIVDLLLSKGKGIDIHYVYPEKLADIIKTPLSLTPGENTVAVVAIALALCYCWIKTRHVLKTIAGALLPNIGVLLAFLIPPIMTLTAGLFQIELAKITPVLITRALVCALVVELSIIANMYNRDYFKAMIKRINPLALLNIILVFVIGLLLYRSSIGRFVVENIGSFTLSIIAIIATWAAAATLSNSESSQAEPKNKIIALGLFTAASICALAINFPTFEFVLVGTGCGLLYSVAPLKLQNRPIFSKLPLAFGLFLTALLGWLFAGGEILRFPHIITLYIMVFTTACLYVFDLTQDADKKSDIKTLPELLGKRTAKIIISVFFLIFYLLIPWVFLAHKLLIPSAGLGILQCYLINRKNYKEWPVLLVFALTLIGLIVWRIVT
ncbi:UbiA family prenyltransferase [Candidatus Omnitrophota bacterium]